VKQFMDEEEAFGMFGWYNILEEEEEWGRRCPNCRSKMLRYDANRRVWVCLDCNFEWSKQ
jgi:ribosomal protein L37AE/L43A